MGVSRRRHVSHPEVPPSRQGRGVCRARSLTHLRQHEMPPPVCSVHLVQLTQKVRGAPGSFRTLSMELGAQPSTGDARRGATRRPRTSQCHQARGVSSGATDQGSQRTEVHSFTFWETRSRKLGGLQGHTPSQGFRGRSFPPLPASGGLQASLGHGRLPPPLPPPPLSSAAGKPMRLGPISIRRLNSTASASILFPN